MNIKPLLSEFIGTFALVFIGAGAASMGGTLLVVALAHGLVVMSFIYTYGQHSGTHINPAVTIGLMVTGHIKITNAIMYIIMQIMGAITASALLSFILGGSDSGLGATQFNPESLTSTQAIIIESILTFFLVNSIINTVINGNSSNLAGIVIGATLIFCILLGGPLTGASLNPARTIGPAIITGNMHQVLVYIIGPISGSVLASILYHFVYQTKN